MGHYRYIHVLGVTGFVLCRTYNGWAAAWYKAAGVHIVVASPSGNAEGIRAENDTCA